MRKEPPGKSFAISDMMLVVLVYVHHQFQSAILIPNTFFRLPENQFAICSQFQTFIVWDVFPVILAGCEVYVFRYVSYLLWILIFLSYSLSSCKLPCVCFLPQLLASLGCVSCPPWMLSPLSLFFSVMYNQLLPSVVSNTERREGRAEGATRSRSSAQMDLFVILLDNQPVMAFT